MKIAILSTSDTIGGAAIVTASLADALSQRGHEVEFITLRGKRERKPSFLAERLGILLRNGFRRDSLFKVSIADFGERGVLRFQQVCKRSPEHDVQNSHFMFLNASRGCYSLGSYR